MELDEKLNESYNKDKEAYQKALRLEGKLEQLKKELKIKKDEKEDAQIKKIRAQRDNDKTAEENADKEVEKADKEVQEIKSKIDKIAQIISKSKEKVDSYIKEISKNPEMQAQINSILEKRYNRAIKKVTDKKDKVDSIINLCEQHPSLENDLKGMIRASEELEKISNEKQKLSEELQSLDIGKDADRITQIKSVEMPALMTKESNFKMKDTLHKDKIMLLCQKNNLDIDEKFLRDLIKENGFARDKDGNIKALKSLKNISNGYDKQIRTYEKSIEKIPGARVYEDMSGQAHGESKTEEGRGVRTAGSRSIDDDLEESSGDNLPDKKYKWYEFRKRFNAWREKRKVQKEKISSGDSKSEESKEDESKLEKKENKFKDAYKYDIVKDYVNKKEEEILMESAKEVRKDFNKEKQDSKSEDER